MKLSSMMRTIKRGSTGEDVKVLQRALSLKVDGIFGALTEEAVKEFQRVHGLVVDGIVGARTWAALPSGSAYKHSRRYITEIIVHCTATPEGRDVTNSQIRQWHRARGFSDIGYHYVVYLNGSVHLGRDVDLIGAHCTGHNTHSIGVCYVGGVAADGKTPKDTRTPSQRDALIKLLRELKMLYPQATIHGHREFAAKACPCFDAFNEYKDL